MKIFSFIRLVIALRFERHAIAQVKTWRNLGTNL